MGGVIDYFLFVIDMLSSFPSMFVIIFFVLSGFFIARSLELKSYSPLFFYGDRLIRIYIPYLASLLIGFLALHYAYILNPDLFLVITDRPYNHEIKNAMNDLNLMSLLNATMFLPGESGLYFGNNNPYWSLYYELLFYITIPFIILYIKKYFFLLLSFLLYTFSFFTSFSFISVFSYFFDFMIYFAFGVTLYQVLQTSLIRYRIIKALRQHTNFFVLFSFLFLLMSIPFGILGFGKLSHGLTAIGTLLLIVWVLYGSKTQILKFSHKIIVNRFSNFLGKISFSVYLIHVPIFVLMYSMLNLLTGEIVYYTRIYWIPVIIALILGYLFYLLFESPSLLLLKAYKKKYSLNKCT